MTRLIVLPFRVLRPDPETDFLAFSVPDAITASLSGLDALVVRSTAAGQRFAGESPDLKAIATEAGVDVVADWAPCCAPATRSAWPPRCWRRRPARWSAPTPPRSQLTDIFQLQDDLARQIVESLAIPLSARDHRLLGQDRPGERQGLRPVPPGQPPRRRAPPTRRG